MIKLIAFLGNYGDEYKNTRHNVAWQFYDHLLNPNNVPISPSRTVIECLRRRKCIEMTELNETSASNTLKKIIADSDATSLSKFNATFSTVKLPNRTIYILRPLTYMNKSGDAVGECSSFYKINSNEILIIHDELEIPFGTVSFKVSGGLGGHNGLRSIKAALGDANFIRLRFGISKPANTNIADYVLSNFTAIEKQNLPYIFNAAETILNDALTTDDFAPLVKKYAKVAVAPPVLPRAE